MVQINVEDLGWKFVFSCFKLMYSAKIIPILLVILGLYLMINRKEKYWKVFLIFILFLCFTIYNPLIIPFFIQKFNIATVYYRFYWILPIVTLLAYGITHVIMEESTSLKKILLFAIFCLLIAGTGNYTYAAEENQKTENIYHVPEDIIQVTDIIHTDSNLENPTVVFDTDLNTIARQYDPSLHLALNRDIVIDIMGISVMEFPDGYRDSEEYRQQQNLVEVSCAFNEIPADDLKESLDYKQVNYVVQNRYTELHDLLKSVGCERIGESINYIVYRYSPNEPSDHTATFSPSTSVLQIENHQESGQTFLKCSSWDQENPYDVIQLPMTDQAGGACYALTSPNAGLIMIDSGYDVDGPYISDFIIENGGVVESWFITHPHIDHVGGLLNILSTQDITIKNIYYSPFTDDFFTTPAEGKDLDTLNYAVLFNEFESAKVAHPDINFIPVYQDDLITLDASTKLSVYCMNSFNPELYDVNGNSLVLRFDIKGGAFMMTGDMTDNTLESMVDTYGESSELWNVNFLTAPHHGYIAGISADTIYQLTQPDYVFVDCSTDEFENNKVGIRDHLLWLDHLNIPVIMRFHGPNYVSI